MSWGLPGPCFVPPQGSRSSLATSGCMALSWTLFLSAPSQYHSQSHVSTWSEQILLPPTDFHSSLLGNLDFGLLISVNCSQLSVMMSWETAICGLLCSETFGLLVPNSCPITVWLAVMCIIFPKPCCWLWKDHPYEIREPRALTAQLLLWKICELKVKWKEAAGINEQLDTISLNLVDMEAVGVATGDQVLHYSIL